MGVIVKTKGLTFSVDEDCYDAIKKASKKQLFEELFEEGCLCQADYKNKLIKYDEEK